MFYSSISILFLSSGDQPRRKRKKIEISSGKSGKICGKKVPNLSKNSKLLTSAYSTKKICLEMVRDGGGGVGLRGHSSIN